MPRVCSCCVHCKLPAVYFELILTDIYLGVAEGPVGMIVCPSRELARQTHEVINGYITALREDGFPELHSLLVMGGIDMKTQVHPFPHVVLCAVHLALFI